MATVSVELLIHARRDWKGEYQYEVWLSDMSRHDFGHVIGKQAITVEVPDHSVADLVNAEVMALNEQKQKVLADAHVKAKEIQERIDSLLAIENKEPSHA